MKAITIWQPYATLIMLGLKRYETRHWSTSYRGPLIIHAAKRWDDDREFDCARVANLLRDHLDIPPKLTDAQRRLLHTANEDTLGKALGIVDLKSCEAMLDGGSEFENGVGSFGEGRFGWECSAPQLFEEPIRHQGQQGLWTPEKYLEQAAQSLLGVAT
jgi:activating signal cointegrator 1